MKTLSLLLYSLCCMQFALANTSNCDNVDNPGRIYHNHSENAVVKFCDAWQPAPLSETLPASGGSGGAIQYQWQYQREDSDWNDISIPEGQNNELNLGQSSLIQYLNNNGVSNSQTVSFRRGARRPDCTNYAYSNEVLYRVYPNVSDDVGPIQGGIFCDYPSGEHCLSIGLGNAYETYEFLWRFSYDNENWIHSSNVVPADYCYPSGTTAYISAGSRLIGSPCDYIFKPSLEVITYRTPELNVEIEPVSCQGDNDGEILVSDISGNSSTLTDLYTYSINNGQSWQSNPRFTGLTAGSYTILVQTQHCNSYSVTASLVASPSPELEDVQVEPESDCGNNDGSINISLVGGIGSFEYRLSTTPWQSNANFDNLSAGNYDLYARNEDGSCETDLGHANIQGPSSPTLSNIAINPPSDCGLDDGQIQIIASGEQGPLSYTIDDGASWNNSSTFHSLSAGQYEAGVRNQDGTCELYQSVSLDAPASPIIESVSSQNPSNCGSGNGQISIQADGQGSSLQYTIDGGTNWSTQNSFTGLAPGFYEIQVRKSNGTCVIDHPSIVELSAPSSPEVSSIEVDQPSDCQVDDGEIRIYPSSSDWQYSIDGGGTWQAGSGIFSGLGPGSYEPYVRNEDGTCPNAAGAAVELSYPNQPAIVSIDYDHPTDWCISDGYLSINATGGEGALEYSRNGIIWQSSPDFSDLGAATLSPGVRNANGSCQVFLPETILIDFPDRPSIAQVTDTPDSGCGANDGSIFIAAEDGIGEYDYSIDGGNSWQSSPLFADLSSGNYNIAVKNKDGSCNITDDVYVPQLLKPRVTDIDIQTPSDCGLADASIRITGDRGTGDFQFTIDAGQTWSSNALFTGLAPGDYWLGIRNSTGYCEEYENAVVTVSERPHKVITDVNVEQPSDCDLNDGEITLFAQGNGVSEYSIDGGNSWQSSRTFRDLAPGTYQPIVRNTDGTCQKPYGASFTLNYPPRPVFEDLIAEATSDCGVSDGSITVIAGEGTGSFQYSINDGNSWQNSSVFASLQATTYGKLAIRNSDGTCYEEYLGSVQVTQPPKPTFDNIEIDQPSDCNIDDGSIEITADDGIGNYEYTFNGGNSWLTQNELNNLEPGSYDLGIRNSDGTCPIYANDSKQLSYPPEPSIADIDFDQPSDCNANDGAISIQAADGTGNFQFSIDGGNSWKNNGNFSNLQAGDYKIAIRNSNGTCLITNNQSIELQYPPEPSIADIDFDQPSDCNANDGAISIQAADGTGNFQFSIDGGNSWKNNGIFNNLQAGVYEIAIRNSNGTCLITNNQSIKLEYPPEPSIADVDFDHPSDCNTNDGIISIQAADGTGNFQFSIDGGNSWKNNGIFNNLQAGVYEIAIRNSNGTCLITNNQSIKLEYPPEPSIANVDFDQPSDCNTNDGAISIQAADGTGNFQFSIDGGNSWKNNGIFNNLQAGGYEIAIRNSNGTCLITDNQSIELQYPPEPSIADVDFDHPSDCNTNDGIISIQAADGTGNFQFSIDGGNSWKNNGNFNNLQAGVYEIAIRNANGTCLITNNQSIELQYPPEPSITDVDFDHPSDCNTDDGAISIQAANGTGNFQFSIDGGNSWKNNGNFNNLQAGDYEIAVRNANGTCLITNNQSIELQYPPEPSIADVDFDQPSDCNTNDGIISIQAADGTGNFQFSIDGGNSWKNNGNFNNLQAGVYEIAIRNANGTCLITDNQSIELEYPPEPSIADVDFDQPSDCNTDDGTISIQAANGTGNFQFSIDGGNSWKNNGNFNNLQAGVYEIAIRNANGTCLITNNQSIELQYPPEPSITDVDFDHPSDCGLNDGAISISGSGGVGSFSFSIDGGINWQNSNTFNNLSPGNYQLGIANADGTCEVFSGNGIEIAYPHAPEIIDLIDHNPSGCGSSDGYIEIVSISGSGATSYSIDNGSSWTNNNKFTNLAPGVYTIRVRNQNQTCEQIYGEVQLNAPSSPAFNNLEQTSPSDCGLDNGQIIISATEGTGSYQYSIDAGQNWHNNGTFNNLASGDYTPSIRNSNGTCQVNYQGSVVLEEPEPAGITGVSIEQPSDCGLDDGRIEVFIDQGVAGFQFSINGGNTWHNNPIFTNLEPGVYQVGLRKNSGQCEVISAAIYQLTYPEAPEITAVSHENVSDCGVQDGMIQISAQGGVGNFEYSIDNGQSWLANNLFSNLAAGSYTVGIRNIDQSCPLFVNAPITITEPVAPILQNIDINHPTNCEDNDGSIAIEVEGTTNNKHFSIDGGQSWQSSPLFNELPPGNYPIAVSNADGTCLVEFGDQIQLETPSAPSILAVSVQQVSNCEVFDAEIQINALAGSGPTLYSIDNGNTWHSNSTFHNLSPGVYQIVVSNENGACPVKYAEPITLSPLNPPEIVQVFLDSPSDCGETDGKLEIEAEGFGQEILYSVDGGSSWKNAPLFEHLSPGQYSIAIKYVDGTCEVRLPQAVTITAPEAPRILDVLVEASSSCSDPSGSIQIATFPTTGIEYSINGGNSWSGQAFYNNLAPGTYQVSIRLSNGSCQVDALEAIHISAPAAPELQDILVDQPSGCGNEDALIQIIARGTGALQYSIDGGINWSNESVFENLSPGQYQIALQNADGGCTIFSDQSIQIIPSSAPEILGISTQSISDCGLQDGEITIEASGEKEVEYAIDNGMTWQLNSTFTGLAAGDYFLSVRYTDGSCVLERIETIQITSPIAPIITGIQTEIVTDCDSPNASLEILTNQSEEDLLYSIDGGESWHTSPIFTNLDAGEYPISIRYINGNCQVNANALIEIEALESISITDVIVNQPSSCDSIPASVTILSEAPEQLEYSIDGGEHWTAESSFQNLSAGSYNIVTRLIGSNCQTEWPDTISIQERNDVGFAIAELEVQNSTQCQLSNGSVNILTGQANLLFSLDNGEQWQTSPFFDQLSIGTYQLLAQDSISGCTGAIGNFTIAGGATPQIENVGIILPSSCASEDGGIFINPADPNLLYSIDAGQTWQTNNQFSGLNPGIYFVAVSSQDSTCQTDYEIPVRLSAQDAATIWQVNASVPSGCGEADAGLQVTVLEDESLFEFSINQGQSWQDTSLFIGLSSGAYQIQVRNKEVGCVSIYYPPVVIPDPPAYENLMIQEQLPSFCGAQDGSILINYTNSASDIAAYSIDGGANWHLDAFFDSLPGGIYDVRIKLADAACDLVHLFPINLGFTSSTDSLQIEVLGVTDCQGDDGSIRIHPPDEGNFEFSIDRGQHYQSSSIFTNLAAGSYLVRMRDVTHQCEYEHPETVEISSLSPPNILEVHFDSPSECAQTGSIAIHATSADLLEYSIDAGVSWQKDSLFTQLLAGDYQVAVRYLNGSCLTTYPELIRLIDSSASSFMEVYWERRLCYGDSLHIGDSVITAAGNYQINIRGENTCDSLIHLSVSTFESIIDQIDITICEGEVYELGGFYYSEAGFYQDTLQSVHGCDSIITLQLSVNQIDTTEFSIGLCEGERFQYGDESLTEPGSYIFTHQGTWGCDSIVIIDLQYMTGPPPTEWLVETPSNCEAMDGSIQIVNSLPFLLYSIDSGLNWQNQGLFPGLGNGIHQLLIRDIQTNCIRQEEIAILPDALPQVDTIKVFPGLACDGVNGEISFRMLDTSQLYLYSIDAGQTWQDAADFTKLSAGVYDLYISQLDSSCAYFVQHAEIYATDSLEIEVLTIDYDACQADSNGVIGVYVAQGTSPYEYHWSNGGDLPEIDQLPPGDYALTVTDSRGCQDSISLALPDQNGTLPSDSLLQDTFYLCKGEMLDLFMPEEELSYSWRGTNGFSAEGNQVQIDAGGQYVLTLSSLHGCAVTDSFHVLQGTDHFQANFLLPAVGLINTSIFAVEVSWPIPAWVNWITDDENIHQLSTYLNQTELQFTAAGTYQIRMEAQLGDCIQEVEKFITIYTDPDSISASNGPITGGSILDFTLFPNPNDGKFELLAEFTDIQTAQIRIYTDTGVLIEARDLSGWASYRESFQLPGAVAGNYIAVLQTQFDHRTLNFLIQR